MKLKTIWTIRGMSLAERFRRTREEADIWIARHLPRRIAYWSFVIQASRNMKSDEVVPEARYVTLLQRMEK